MLNTFLQARRRDTHNGVHKMKKKVELRLSEEEEEAMGEVSIEKVIKLRGERSSRSGIGKLLEPY